MQTPTHVLIRAEMPGVRKQDIALSLVGRMLSITASHPPPTSEPPSPPSQASEESESAEDKANKKKEERWLVRECGRHSGKRTVQLPEGLDSNEGVQASFENGVLSLSLSKRKPASHTITIS